MGSDVLYPARPDVNEREVKRAAARRNEAAQEAQDVKETLNIQLVSPSEALRAQVNEELGIAVDPGNLPAMSVAKAAEVLPLVLEAAKPIELEVPTPQEVHDAVAVAIGFLQTLQADPLTSRSEYRRTLEHIRKAERELVHRDRRVVDINRMRRAEASKRAQAAAEAVRAGQETP